MPRVRVAQEILSERARQDEKWGGAANDDEVSPMMWRDLITTYASWAWLMWEMRSTDKARRRLIQVAALAIAAIEAIDRREAQ